MVLINSLLIHHTPFPFYSFLGITFINKLQIKHYNKYKGTKKEQNLFSENKEKKGTGRFNIYINNKAGEIDREKGKIFSVIAQSYPLICSKARRNVENLDCIQEKKNDKKGVGG